MDNQVAQQSNEQIKNVTAPSHRHKLTFAAFIVTLLAWVSLPINYIVSMTLCIVGLVLSAIALRQPRSGVRNLAIVTVIAAAILALIFIIIWSGLLYIAFAY